MTPRRTLSERVVEALVAGAAWIVPPGRRDDFRREWEAEFAHRFHPDPPASPPGRAARVHLVYRGLLAAADALTLRLQEVTVDSLFQDVRFAARTLLRRPGFTVLALLTIALGIGANTAIFTVVNSVLLRPLPYPDPHELVMIWEQDRTRGWDRVPTNAEDFLAWQAGATTFEALGAGQNASFTLAEGGEPEQVPGFRVTAGFFQVFGVAPLLGRPFGPEANVDGAHRQVVLSHALWQRRFGGDPGIVGTAIGVDGDRYEVVAVMPEGFQFPSAARMWAPIVFSEAQLQDRNWHFLLTVGRVADGSDVEAARAEMRTIAARLTEDFPDSNDGWGVDVFPLHGEMTNAVRSMLLVLLGAVGFVLLIACANVANLLLVRASGRARELSVRTALGAGKARLVRQLLTESVLLAGLGGLLGLGLAYLALDLLLALSPIVVPGGGQVRIDTWVLLATALGALGTGVFFGLAPAVSVWRTDLQSTLKEGRGQAGGSGRRMRGVLVVTEMALALVLVTGAGLMLQSVQRLLDVDVGVDTDNVLVTQFSLPGAAYPTQAEQVLFYDQLLERAAAIPGVRGAALTPLVPPASGGQFHVRIEGVHDAWTMDLPVARSRGVSVDYFEVMGIPLVRGRTFTEADGGDSELVVVVDQAFVEAHFPSEDPLGRQIRTLLDQPRQIIGVVGNVANSGLGNEAGPTTYFPYRQQAFGNTMSLVVRTQADPYDAVPSVQEAVWGLDPDLPLVGVASLEDRLAQSVSQSRFNSTLLTLFAVLALVLAGVGIYGVMAFTVTERTAELGLRMALGASGSSVRSLVVRKAMALTAGGILVGVLASLALTRVIASFLYGVEPTDPLTLGVVAVLLCLVALTASYLPALRASRLDPLRALREE
ncbi:MAG: ABC transporter permease [Longimicrobiales bacterium]